MQVTYTNLKRSDRQQIESVAHMNGCRVEWDRSGTKAEIKGSNKRRVQRRLELKGYHS